ncbi:MAG: class I SAM-dependent methyltransferase [Planctomycetes bacterium]|nr:class I SAM-dependent methyltransferase [Planctomycetota bacterium]
MTLLGLVERLYYTVHRRGDVLSVLRARLAARAPLRDVLDFGGGTGRVAAALAPGLEGTWTVADVDSESLARVTKSPRIRPIQIPERGPLPFPDASFDAILSVDVLHHVPAAEGTLAEWKRCLRPGGLVLAVEFDGGSGAGRFLARVARWRRQPCRFWRPGELAGGLEHAGLAATTERIDALRYVAEGTKPIS